MHVLIVMLLRKIGTDALLFVLKELVKMLESRPDNNISEDDVKAVCSRVEDARVVATPTLTRSQRRR
jgi:hypothetical protein